MPQVTPDCKYPNLIKISSYFFDIKYTSESEGYLSIEELSPEFNSKDAIKKVNALPFKNDFGNFKVNHERTIIISLELGVIVSSGDFRAKIKKNYFENVLEINAKKINIEIIIIMNAKKILIYHLLKN